MSAGYIWGPGLGKIKTEVPRLKDRNDQINNVKMLAVKGQLTHREYRAERERIIEEFSDIAHIAPPK
eukprot:CAMPEP_0177692436 /NCGR_PEP_ID=MMETSP0484_2-20121128/1851_1 /TAXON_ID=354590 /ORGANISM="Rhodomonas lens, Strain RHODO" /LENGTH=66 /DNA_ID=CAMNT_0019203151 /DNA_START=32 /DNA_END=232 /DNA_ORIENTATION=-